MRAHPQILPQRFAQVLLVDPRAPSAASNAAGDGNRWRTRCTSRSTASAVGSGGA
jgi:hypothetical protein